jgi:Delta3-Delta2-enoyl-CoA isomerase
MEHILSKKDGELAVLVMSRGKANAINSAMMEELFAAVGSAAADPGVRGLVLASDQPRFFSSGFDVREVFHYGREQMAGFFRRFTGLYEALRAMPKPVVGALGGHTFAGGAILALACDLRVMARGDFGFAVNEINLGLALTPEIGRMLMEAVGAGRARELFLSGEPVTPERAWEIGLVHELAAPEQVLERAVARARLLAAKPPVAFAAIKQQLRSLAAGETPDAGVEQFLELWFSPEAIEARRRVAGKLGG